MIELKRAAIKTQLKRWCFGWVLLSSYIREGQRLQAGVGNGLDRSAVIMQLR
ncbi:hypothetical protein [Acetanaerobacterium elongatum]|uniref:Uncharacterized protein n=1 Tax=Acetanaerobacterium elongatum TaxID=258515 RepID=A0A1H0G3H8_9FIRM|nr:hypothetical protein [Acetanaerobacterium elongatum]SDO01455.1 hypothetical protein SAMN05192585_1478 [Acetanaerobacterium elongatum]